MTKEDAIARLKAHEAELRAMGIKRLSLFGSTARGEERPGSDVDLAAEFHHQSSFGLFRYAKLAGHLERILEAKIDLIGEPARSPRLQTEIDRDRLLVF